jgi:hypothetical protein
MQYDLVFEGGGGIAAVLLTVGYSSDEIRAALSETVDGRPVKARC